MKNLTKIFILFFVCILLNTPVYSATLKDLSQYGNKIEYDSFYDDICARGWIKNNSNEELTITVTVNLYDKNNKYIETKTTKECIGAQELWKFSTGPINKRAYSMRVVSINIK